MSLRLREMMVADVKYATFDSPLSETLRMMEGHGIDQVPVVQDGESMTLMGVLDTRQCARHGLTQDRADTHRLMVPGFVEPLPEGGERTPDEVLTPEVVAHLKVHDYVIVIDADRRLQGIVHASDALEAAFKALESTKEV